MKYIYKFLVLTILLTAMGEIRAQGPTRVSEDFNTSLTPTGWTNSLNAGTLISRVTTVQSFGRAGTVAAIQANNWNVAAGNRAQLETPLWGTPTVLGDSLRFDVAHATYPGNTDSLIIHAFDGVSYNRVIGWGSDALINLAGITTANAQTPSFLPTSGQWLTKAIALPVGTTRVRFEFYSDFGNQLFIDRVIVDSFYSVPQVFASATTTQTNLNNVLTGTSDQEIIGVSVNVTGNNPALPVTSFTFNTGASTNPATDITNAKLYYTGLSSTFATTTLFGSFPTPSGAFTITGSVNLQDGNNRFWLVYDISPTATNANILDAECNSVTVDAIPQTPTVQSPAGSRMLYAPNQVEVNASAGTPSGIYATLKEAFDKINDGTHQGDITITIANSTTETASARLNRSGVGLSSYTKVYISPSATVSVTGNVNGSLVHLKGAENVTIDGRIGLTGNNELTFINYNTSTNTAVIQLSSMGAGLGARFDTISYCNIKAGGFAGALNTFGVYIADSTISNTATGLNNNYNAVVGNTIQKCRYGIYNRGSASSVANYNKSIFISANTIGSTADSVTVSFVGIDCRNNDTLSIANNNILGMVEDLQQVVVRGVDLGGNIINSSINGNFIDNLRNTSITLFRSGQGIFLSTGAASNNVISNNVISNLNGQGSGTFTNNVWGIFVNAGSGIKILFNTIALTGTGINTGSTDRSGCLLLNSAASTAIEVRGNIFFNTRFPGNNAAGFSEGVHSLTTAINLTINNNIYYVTPSNVRFIVGVLAGDRSTLANWQTATGQDVNSLGVNPGIAVTSLGRGRMGIASPAIGAGPTGTAIAADILGDVRGVTPSIGAYENGYLFTDLQPTIIYTLGKLPIPYANPHSLRTSVFNWGGDTAMASKVYISVNGANTILDSLIMPPIPPGGFISVNMPEYSYLNYGVDTVTITVEADSNDANNSKSLVQVINSNTYSYAEPFRPADGGVGFTGATGDFVAKFPYTGSNSINQIGVNFSAGGQTLSIGIWDTAVAGTPGVNLWTSAPFTTVTGLNTIVVNPPIPITGSFYVGVRQTGTVNASFSYQSESPVRAGVFYFASPTGSTTWNDFAPNNPFRFMIEPRLQDADDMGAELVNLPCLNVVQGSPAFTPSVRVFNYGANPQSSFIVQTQITGPINYSSSDTFTSASIPSSSSLDVSLANLFNPNTAGTYNMKVWTILPGDLQSSNDTVTYEFSVSNINAFTNAGNHLTLNGTTQYGVATGSGALNIMGDQLSLEGWISTSSSGTRNIISKDSAVGIHQYNLYLNAAGNVVFKLFTINGVDSVTSATTVPLLTYTHVAATYNSALGEAKVYINGEVVGTKVVFGSIIGNIKPLYIGRGFTTGFFGGNIDELKIWDTCRTDDQIRRGIHTRMANFAHPNLKAYWRMDDGGGTSIADASGNCHAAALFSAPVFGTSTIPLGAPTLYTQNITIPGIVDFTGSQVSMNIYNQVGVNDIYIHQFPGAPFGTQPTGATAVHPNNWIMYRYGSGTMDSAEVSFNTNGITLAADPNDFYLFNRGVGTNTAWFVMDTANMVDPNTGIVTFGVLSPGFMNQFVVGANNNSLPVKMLYFTANGNNADVNLRWATANESDNAGFTIERSTDGKNFTNIGFVKGKGKSSELTTYTSLDKDAFKLAATSKLYYRLVQTDFNGKKEISNTVVVLYGRATEGASIAYPNPFNNEISISIDAKTEGPAKVMLMDITGKLVYEKAVTAKAGLNTLQTNGLDALPKGVYLLQLTINGEVTTQKMVKQ